MTIVHTRLRFPFPIESIFCVVGCLLLLACNEQDSGAPSANQMSSGIEAPSSNPETQANSTRSTKSVESSDDPEARESSPIAGPNAPTVRTLPLEDLLRLPKSVTQPHTDLGKPRSEMDGQSEKEREASRLRVKIRRQQESPEFDPDGSLTRERTDASVLVDVDEETSVGGGVHVVREPNGEYRDPAPTVRVEKRF